jgi:hypothetical protein
MDQDLLYNECAICNNIANAKNSHVIPINVIKECVGKRHNEVSFNFNLLDGSKSVYIGNEIKHKSDEILSKKIEIDNDNPFTLDYILCLNCEKKLGSIESELYSEIISKIRDNRFSSNFKVTNFHNYEGIIPITKKLQKKDIDIYFYSIILRVYYLYKSKNQEVCITLETILKIKNFLNISLYQLENKIELDTKLIVYITDNPKNFPCLLSTNLFKNFLIPCCNFYIILDNNINTPFGSLVNKINDNEFKFIRNSKKLDKYLQIQNDKHD